MVNIGKIVLVLVMSFLLAVVGVYLAGLIGEGWDALFGITFFLIPSVCLLTDLHSRVSRMQESRESSDTQNERK